MDILFDHPVRLLSLWILLPLGLFLWLKAKHTRRKSETFLSRIMAPRLLPEFGAARSLLRAALFLIGIASLCLAIAGPRWGVSIEAVTRRGADLMVALDVSRSMLSEDVKPSRLERAQSDLLDLLERLGNDRVGLVAFAGKASVVCPLTADHGFFRLALAEVGPQTIAVGGTAIGDAIRTCLENMERTGERDQAIVLITDGEDHDSFPEEAGALAAERKIKVFTVGLGDAEEGARIPAEGDQGQKTFVKHEGQEVWSKMDETLLKTVAATTGGAYVPAQTLDYDLGQIYEDHLKALKAGEFSTEQRKRRQPRYQVFVAIGLLALVLELLINRRSRAARGRALAARSCLAVLLFGGAAEASESNAVNSVEEGLAQLKSGDAEAALESFLAAQELQPEDPIIDFNLGFARKLAGQYEQSLLAYLEAAQSTSPDLLIRAHYNLGELEASQTRKLFGEEPELADPETRTKGIEQLERAIRHWRTCLEHDTEHEDARYNIELTRLWIKHMQNVWAEQDKQKEQEQQQDPIAQLEELMLSCRELWFDTAELSRKEDSAKRRVAIGELNTRQTALAEELAPIQEQILAQLEAPAGGAGGPGPKLSEEQKQQLEQALAFFEQQFDDARTAMRQSNQALTAADPNTAVPAQETAWRSLDAIWMALVPFDRLLSHAIEDQNDVVDALSPFAEDLTRKVGTEDLWDEESRQRRLAGLASLLPPKGEQYAQQIAAPADSQGAANANEDEDPQVPPLAPDPDDPGTDRSAAGEDAQKKMHEQQEAIRKAVQLAKQHAPRIRDLSVESSDFLTVPDAASALPKSKEALRLLEEIAEPLPKNQQNQPQGNQEQDQSQQDQQDQQQQSEPEDSQQQNPEQSNSSEEDSSSREDQTPEEMTPEQMEAVLQQAAENEREAKEKRKKIEAMVTVPRKVEKDW